MIDFARTPEPEDQPPKKPQGLEALDALAAAVGIKQLFDKTSERVVIGLLLRPDPRMRQLVGSLFQPSDFCVPECRDAFATCQELLTKVATIPPEEYADRWCAALSGFQVTETSPYQETVAVLRHRARREVQAISNQLLAAANLDRNILPIMLDSTIELHQVLRRVLMVTANFDRPV